MGVRVSGVDRAEKKTSSDTELDVSDPRLFLSEPRPTLGGGDM